MSAQPATYVIGGRRVDRNEFAGYKRDRRERAEAIGEYNHALKRSVTPEQRALESPQQASYVVADNSPAARKRRVNLANAGYYSRRPSPRPAVAAPLNPPAQPQENIAPLPAPQPKRDLDDVISNATRPTSGQQGNVLPADLPWSGQGSAKPKVPQYPIPERPLPGIGAPLPASGSGGLIGGGYTKPTTPAPAAPAEQPAPEAPPKGSVRLKGGGYLPPLNTEPPMTPAVSAGELPAPVSPQENARGSAVTPLSELSQIMSDDKNQALNKSAPEYAEYQRLLARLSSMPDRVNASDIARLRELRGALVPRNPYSAANTGYGRGVVGAGA